MNTTEIKIWSNEFKDHSFMGIILAIVNSNELSIRASMISILTGQGFAETVERIAAHICKTKTDYVWGE